MIAETVLKPAPAGASSPDRDARHPHSQSGRAGRRDHGLAHRGAPGQRGSAGGAAGYSREGRAAQRHRGAGARSPQEEQAGGVLTTRRLPRASRSAISTTTWRCCADCDWVIEAVTENLAIKQALLDKIAPHLKPDAILTTNTSGLPVASIAAKLPEQLRRRWFGTHFFNPPRYMRLVEIIATPETDPAAVDAVAHFADLRLGKEVVFARDTPNFIANRIGVFIMLEAVRLMQERRPDHRRGGRAHRHGHRLAAHRDVPPGGPGGHRRAGARGRELSRARSGRQSRWPCRRSSRPCWSGAGWATRPNRASTRKRRTPRAKKIRLALDWKTLEYRAGRRGPSCLRSKWRRTPSSCRSAWRNCSRGDVRKDKAARFHWRLLSALWNYAADCLPEIADDACQRGSRHARRLQLGDGAVPALGCRRRAGDRGAHEGRGRAGERRRSSGCWPRAPASWYRDHGRECFDRGQRRLSSRSPKAEGIARVAKFRASQRRGAAEPRRLAGRSGRRRGLPGTALEEERHRRRHRPPGDRDAARRIATPCANFAAFVIIGRRGQLLGGRQPDAAAAEHAGRRMGRRRFRRARLPAHDGGHQVLPAAGGGGAVRLLPRRRSGDRAARRRGGRRMPSCTWAWWRPASGCCPAAAAARR